MGGKHTKSFHLLQRVKRTSIKQRWRNGTVRTALRRIVLVFFFFFSNDDDGRVLGTCCPVVRYRHSDRSVEHSFCFFGRHTEREREKSGVEGKRERGSGCLRVRCWAAATSG